MPLLIPALAKDMMDSTLNQTSAPVAMKKLGDAIAKHIMDNAIVNFAWVGVGPPPASLPDPVTVAVGKISGVVITLTPSFATSAPAAMAHLANEIRVGVMAGLYMPDAPWATSPGNLGTIPILVLTPAMSSSREACFIHMATEIITWITSYVPSAPCAGTNGAFVGVATPTGII